MINQKELYAVEYNNLVVWDFQHKAEAVYLSLFEANQNKHRIWQYYKQSFEIFKKVKFRDFKIVKYIANKEL